MPRIRIIFSQIKLDPSAADTSALWGQVKTGLVREKSNAAGFAFDLRLYYFYTMLQVAFPKKEFSSILKTDNAASLSFNGASYMLDLQTGAGYTFFKKKPVSLFVGGALGFHSRKVLAEVLGKEYIHSEVIAGTGINTVFSFYPLSFFGLYAGIADTVYFLPIKIVRKLDGIELKNSAIKNPIINSFNIKAGIIIRL